MQAMTSAYWEIPLERASGAIRSVRELLQMAPGEVGAAFGFGAPSSAWVYCAVPGDGAEAERTLSAWRSALRPVEPKTMTSLPDANGVTLPPASLTAAAVFINQFARSNPRGRQHHAGLFHTA